MISHDIVRSQRRKVSRSRPTLRRNWAHLQRKSNAPGMIKDSPEHKNAVPRKEGRRKFSQISQSNQLITAGNNSL